MFKLIFEMVSWSLNCRFILARGRKPLPRIGPRMDNKMQTEMSFIRENSCGIRALIYQYMNSCTNNACAKSMRIDSEYIRLESSCRFL